MTRRVLPAVAALIAVALLAATSFGAARHSVRVCHRRHGHRVCTVVHRRTPRRRHHPASTTTTTTTSSSTSSASSAPPVTQTTSTTSTAQTTATQTTTTATTTAPALPHGTEIDERATGQQTPFYALHANETTLAAGTIRFNVYNFDQDPHTFAVQTADGQQLTTAVSVPAGQPRTAVPVTVDLPPGTYVLYCTLPQHAALGMRTTIVVH